MSSSLQHLPEDARPERSDLRATLNTKIREQTARRVRRPKRLLVLNDNPTQERQISHLPSTLSQDGESEEMNRVRRRAHSLHNAHLIDAEGDSDLREYPNQIECARDTIEAIKQGYRFIAVHKEIKSGANGYISRLVYELHTMEDNRAPIETPVLSGYSSTDMVEETSKSIYCGAIPKGRESALRKGILVLHNGTLNRLEEPIFTENARRGKMVFIVDEADHGSDEKQRLADVLKRKIVDGDVLVMITATDELIHQRIDKWAPAERDRLTKSIELKTGENYIGWREFTRRGILQHIPTMSGNKLAEHLVEMIDTNEKPLSMLRLVGNLRDKFIKRIAKSSNLKVVSIDMSTNKLKKLEDVTKKAIAEYNDSGEKTVILLKGMYRRAKKFNDELKCNIGLIYEDASRVETAAQGACARMCGYWKEEFLRMETKPMFYCNLHRITEYLNAQDARREQTCGGKYEGTKSTRSRGGKVKMRKEGLGSAGVVGAPAREITEAPGRHDHRGEFGLLIGFKTHEDVIAFAKETYNKKIRCSDRLQIRSFADHIRWRNAPDGDKGRALRSERSEIRVFKLRGEAKTEMNNLNFVVWMALSEPGSCTQLEHGKRLKRAYDAGVFSQIAEFGEQARKLEVWKENDFDLEKVKRLYGERFL